jgi:GntR family transcriptional regulator
MEEYRIVDGVLAEIAADKYQPDEKLPSEHEMAQRYQVPRIAVRKAYERLKEMGCIYTLQGKGSFVQGSRKPIPLLLSGGESFSSKMQAMGISYETKNLFCQPIPDPKRIYQYLECPSGDRIYKIGRLRIIEGRPSALHVSCIAQSAFPAIAEEGPAIVSMFSYYREKGYTQFVSKPSILSVTFPTAYEREQLACSHLIPLLVVQTGCCCKKTGQVLERTKILYRSDCFKYIVR